MAKRDGDASIEAEVNRSVGRLIGNVFFLLLLLAAGIGWGSFGYYQLNPGQSAIVFRLGEYQRTVSTPGPKLRWPAPFESHEILNVSEIMRQEFGVGDGADQRKDRVDRHESSMQTADNNIVDLGFVVQYRVSDAFESRYRVAELEATLRDAAQAAVRQVVGTMTIDGVITEQRGEVQIESQRILQDVVDSYAMGIEIMELELQQVQPPEEVREAFDDVKAAAQDALLLINQAKGYRNEVLPKARAQAAELSESAIGYRDSKIAEARGEAGRFVALLAVYQLAPEVTRKRLYLETMESVLPDVEKVIIEPGASGVMPFLPLMTSGGRQQ
jgi:membrane protease subunit HflK